jgi:hypothetical protein
LTARVVARTPITFDVASGGITHAPLVTISVSGSAPARYVLDTGSDVHLLNEDLADELGLTKEPGEEGTDHSGTTMPSWNVGDVNARVDDCQLVLRNAVAIPAPPPFPAFGIRGILSPQHLHASAWTVLDLSADELVLVETANDQEATDYLRARSPRLELLTLARDAKFRSLVVPAALEGFARCQPC